MALQDNLVSNYRFEGNSNDNADSKNGSDSNISYSLSYGKITQGASFNGSSSKIDITIPFNPNGNYWTINFWFKTSTSQPWFWLMDFNDYGSSGDGNQAFVLTCLDNKVRCSIGTWFTSVPSDYSSQTQLNDDEWYMWSLTRDGTNWRTYINGSQYGSTTSINPDDFPDSGTLHIGRGPSTGDWYEGYMDEVSYWTRTLSGSELSTLYNSGVGMFYNGSTFESPATDESTGFFNFF